MNFDWLGEAFDFLTNTHWYGLSLTSYLCIMLILGAVVLFIRGNK